jgi:ketol-acid reductoisomerase
MHQITQSMKTAQRGIKAGKSAFAQSVLKKAENKNEKLVKLDKNVRDPLIKKCKREMKK